MDIIQKLAAEFKIKTSQVQHTVELMKAIPYLSSPVTEKKQQADLQT